MTKAVSNESGLIIDIESILLEKTRRFWVCKTISDIFWQDAYKVEKDFIRLSYLHKAQKALFGLFFELLAVLVK